MEKSLMNQYFDAQLEVTSLKNYKETIKKQLSDAENKLAEIKKNMNHP